MKTSLKAALAGVAGAGLLLGGAGSLAYWTDTESGSGTSLNGGELSMSGIDCDDWFLNASTTAFDDATDLIVPGDVLTRDCTTTLTVTGGSLTGELVVGTPDLGEANGLSDELDVDSVFTVAGGSPVTTAAIDTGDHGATVALTTTIDFSFADATNASNAGLSAILEEISLTLTQTATP